jgi:23S rRNA (guanosine2251-2'-O)-methyltransferase
VERLYGRNAVREALRVRRRHFYRLLIATGSHELGDVVAAASREHIPIEMIDRHRLDGLAGTHHQGIVAEVDPFPYVALTDLLDTPSPLLLALDSLQDPQNFGTLLRTAQSVGVNGVIIPEHRAVGVTPAVSNASAGAVEHLAIARVTNLARALQQLKSHGIWVFGLAVDAGHAYWSADLSGALALVVGSEGSGLGRLIRETCDVLLHVPMAPGSVQSLNASVAGSLALYEVFRQRTPPTIESGRQ